MHLREMHRDSIVELTSLHRFCIIHFSRKTKSSADMNNRATGYTVLSPIRSLEWSCTIYILYCDNPKWMYIKAESLNTLDTRVRGLHLQPIPDFSTTTEIPSQKGEVPLRFDNTTSFCCAKGPWRKTCYAGQLPLHQIKCQFH